LIVPIKRDAQQVEDSRKTEAEEEA